MALDCPFIDLTPPLITACRDFAKESVSTHAIYSKSGQKNPDKIMNQIFHGKAGELATSILLSGMGEECSCPDFAIYKGRQKSFSADLMWGDRKIHVKTQDSASAGKYGLSWTFQWGGISGRKDKLFKSYDALDYVAFCLLEGDRGYLCGLVSIDHLFTQNKFKDPVLVYLRNEKKVVYYEDIKGDAWFLDIRGGKQSSSP